MPVATKRDLRASAARALRGDGTERSFPWSRGSPAAALGCALQMRRPQEMTLRWEPLGHPEQSPGETEVTRALRSRYRREPAAAHAERTRHAAPAPTPGGRPQGRGAGGRELGSKVTLRSDVRIRSRGGAQSGAGPQSRAAPARSLTMARPLCTFFTSDSVESGEKRAEGGGARQRAAGRLRSLSVPSPCVAAPILPPLLGDAAWKRPKVERNPAALGSPRERRAGPGLAAGSSCARSARVVPRLAKGVADKTLKLLPRQLKMLSRA